MPEVELFEDRRGRQPVRDYIRELERRGRLAEVAAIARDIDLLEEHGAQLGMPFARIIDREHRIYELRPGAHRIAFALHRGAAVLLHAWRKRTQRLDDAELSVARRRLGEWLDSRANQ